MPFALYHHWYRLAKGKWRIRRGAQDFNPISSPGAYIRGTVGSLGMKRRAPLRIIFFTHLTSRPAFLYFPHSQGYEKPKGVARSLGMRVWTSPPVLASCTPEVFPPQRFGSLKIVLLSIQSCRIPVTNSQHAVAKSDPLPLIFLASGDYLTICNDINYNVQCAYRTNPEGV